MAIPDGCAKHDSERDNESLLRIFYDAKALLERHKKTNDVFVFTNLNPDLHQSDLRLGVELQDWVQRLRNELLERYLPLTQVTARRLLIFLDEDFEIEDLQSAAIFALMDALDVYNPYEDGPFDVYVAPQMWHDIVAELTCTDWHITLVRKDKYNVKQEPPEPKANSKEDGS
jgi:hypothetical protein